MAQSGRDVGMVATTVLLLGMKRNARDRRGEMWPEKLVCSLDVSEEKKKQKQVAIGSSLLGRLVGR